MHVVLVASATHQRPVLTCTHPTSIHHHRPCMQQPLRVTMVFGSNSTRNGRAISWATPPRMLRPNRVLTTTVAAGSKGGSQATPQQNATKAKDGSPGRVNKQSTPPRVSNNHPLSVRKQIQLIRTIKRMAVQRTTRPAMRTSYRRDRKKESEEDMGTLQRAAATGAGAPSVPLSPALANLYGTAGDRSPPVLVVDGYNFLHQWRSLCHNEEGSPIGEDTSMEDARDAVVRALEVYSQFRGVRVVVVFDAMSNPLGSSRHTTPAAVEVVFSAECEADSYIIVEVKRLLVEGAPYVYVVTQDGVLSDSVLGNDNTWTMSHAALHRELLRAARDVDKELAEMTRARMGRTSLGRALLHHNPEVFEQLERSRCTQNKWAIPGAVLGDRRRNKWKAKRNG